MESFKNQIYDYLKSSKQNLSSAYEVRNLLAELLPQIELEIKSKLFKDVKLNLEKELDKNNWGIDIDDHSREIQINNKFWDKNLIIKIGDLNQNEPFYGLYCNDLETYNKFETQIREVFGIMKFENNWLGWKHLDDFTNYIIIINLFIDKSFRESKLLEYSNVIVEYTMKLDDVLKMHM